MDVKAGLPAYQRVVETIKTDIMSGRLAPNARLPGHRALADQHGVALATLQKALKVLEDDGWLTASPAVGVFVNEHQPDAPDVSVSLGTISQQLDKLQATVESLNDRVRILEERQDQSPPAAPSV
jgi:GntR family transcriptional regulator